MLILGKRKPWLSIDEQIDLLHSRGVVISNREEAKTFLLENNYFRVSGFTLPLRKDDVFQFGINFDDIIQICSFDCEIRTLLMGILSHVEITYRSLIAYYHTKRFGPMGYERSIAFSDLKIYAGLITKVYKLKKNYEDNPEIFVKHYVEDKNGQLPFWAVVELLSFTDISKIFRALTCDVKKEIIDDYLDLRFGSAPDYVANWLWCASVLRNIVAHRGRLYNRYLHIKPKLSKTDKNNLLHTKSKNVVLNKLFAYIIAIRHLEPNKNLWNDFAYDVFVLSERFPFVNLTAYGFPPNWKAIISFS